MYILVPISKMAIIHLKLKRLCEHAVWWAATVTSPRISGGYRSLLWHFIIIFGMKNIREMYQRFSPAWKRLGSKTTSLTLSSPLPLSAPNRALNLYVYWIESEKKKSEILSETSDSVLLQDSNSISILSINNHMQDVIWVGSLSGFSPVEKGWNEERKEKKGRWEKITTPDRRGEESERRELLEKNQEGEVEGCD